MLLFLVVLIVFNGSVDIYTIFMMFNFEMAGWKLYNIKKNDVKFKTNIDLR